MKRVYLVFRIPLDSGVHTGLVGMVTAGTHQVAVDYFMRGKGNDYPYRMIAMSHSALQDHLTIAQETLLMDILPTP